MNKEAMLAFAREATKGMKTQEDLATFRQILLK